MMKNLTRRFFDVALLVSGFLFAAFSSAAQETGTSDSEQQILRSTPRSFAIYYVQNGIDIDEHYLDNEWQISQIRKYLVLSPKVDSITIYSYASPEGVYERNVWLARKRGEAARRFIVNSIPEGSSLTGDLIRLKPTAENWAGLREEIVRNYTLQNKDRVLRIIDADIPDDTKKWRLKNLDNGYTWNYIIRHNMPRLRYATWICVWVEPTIPALDMPERPLAYTSPMTLAQPAQEISVRPEYERQMIFAGRTNLLVPGLNFGVEIPIGRHVSIGADYWYPWWLAKSNKYCGEMLGWFIDGKYWFTGKNGKYEWARDDKLKGHALGAYAGAGYYDYQKLKSGYQGEYLDLGVDYTFGLPIGRRSKWMRMEFNIGVGCILTKARHYVPTSDYVDLIKDPGIKNKYYTYFGPTRAGVSFVMPIIVKRKIKGGVR